MEFKKEFLEMTKGELILYFSLLSDGDDGERVVNRYDYEDMGFKESTFYLYNLEGEDNSWKS